MTVLLLVFFYFSFAFFFLSFFNEMSFPPALVYGPQDMVTILP